MSASPADPEQCMSSLSERYFLIFDHEAHAVHLHGGTILGEFSSREAALRAAKARGLRLSESGAGRPPDPPAASVTA
jgi:hypothetical protein